MDLSTLQLASYRQTFAFVHASLVGVSGHTSFLLGVCLASIPEKGGEWTHFRPLFGSYNDNVRNSLRPTFDERSAAR